jgi:hypothetical protein
MIANLFELELQYIDHLSRERLIETVRFYQACLAPDLLEGLEEKSTDHLQLLVLAGRLIHVLRQQCDLD